MAWRSATVLLGGAIVTEDGAQARQESTQALRIPDQLDQNRHKIEMTKKTGKWVTLRERRIKSTVNFVLNLWNIRKESRGKA